MAPQQQYRKLNGSLATVQEIKWLPSNNTGIKWLPSNIATQGFSNSSHAMEANMASHRHAHLRDSNRCSTKMIRTNYTYCTHGMSHVMHTMLSLLQQSERTAHTQLRGFKPSLSKTCHLLYTCHCSVLDVQHNTENKLHLHPPLYK